MARATDNDNDTSSDLRAPNPSTDRAAPRDDELQAALDVVSDPVRRSILRQLASEPDWTFACGTFDLPVSKPTSTHHFSVLRRAGLLEQRDAGTRRLNRLRRDDFERRFPGLLDLVLSAGGPPVSGDRRAAGPGRSGRPAAGDAGRQRHQGIGPSASR
jgi:DNA-binding transcriptional ArsR family regulator